MSEKKIQSGIMLALGRGSSRIFRNHVGEGWTGRMVSQDGPYTTLVNARRCSFGLMVGSSDLIGWQSVVITPEMVGQTVAIFTAVEVKNDKGGVVSDEQSKFVSIVLKAGGRAGIARSDADAHAIANGLVATPSRLV